MLPLTHTRRPGGAQHQLPVSVAPAAAEQRGGLAREPYSQLETNLAFRGGSSMYRAARRLLVGNEARARASGRGEAITR